MQFPSKCPYCGKDIVPNCTSSVNDLDFVLSLNNNDQLRNTLELHRCIHCKKPIFVVFAEVVNKNTIKKSDVIFYYPTVQSVDFPDRIKKLSPTAHKTYEQTIKAKEQGFDALVGAGLRISLEWLVWDYLIKVAGKTESELEKLKLYERIKLMNTNFYTEVCTRLIRLFGNDNVHIVKQIDFSVDEVLEIFELLCSLIDGELQIKEVNERLPKKS